LDDTTSYTYQFYYENEVLGTLGEFSNGLQTGSWNWWYDNEFIMDQATLINGNYIGKRKHYREDGTLRQIEIIKDTCVGGACDKCCDGTLIFYNDSGIKFIEYTLKNSKFDGIGKGYYTDGTVKRQFKYIDGQKQGKNYEYHRNGEISAEGEYINDLEEGKWVYRDSSGTITGFDIYHQGNVTSGH
jgi:antitoxin component YwqK of YwqJK toxin-antitoxin module